MSRGRTVRGSSASRDNSTELLQLHERLQDVTGKIIEFVNCSTRQLSKDATVDRKQKQIVEKLVAEKERWERQVKHALETEQDYVSSRLGRQLETKSPASSKPQGVLRLIQHAQERLVKSVEFPNYADQTKFRAKINSVFSDLSDQIRVELGVSDGDAEVFKLRRELTDMQEKLEALTRELKRKDFQLNEGASARSSYDRLNSTSAVQRLTENLDFERKQKSEALRDLEKANSEIEKLQRQMALTSSPLYSEQVSSRYRDNKLSDQISRLQKDLSQGVEAETQSRYYTRKPVASSPERARYTSIERSPYKSPGGSKATEDSLAYLLEKEKERSLTFYRALKRKERECEDNHGPNKPPIAEELNDLSQRLKESIESRLRIEDQKKELALENSKLNEIVKDLKLKVLQVEQTMTFKLDQADRTIKVLTEQIQHGQSKASSAYQSIVENASSMTRQRASSTEIDKLKAEVDRLKGERSQESWLEVQNLRAELDKEKQKREQLQQQVSSHSHSDSEVSRLRAEVESLTKSAKQQAEEFNRKEDAFARALAREKEICRKMIEDTTRKLSSSLNEQSQRLDEYQDILDGCQDKLDAMPQQEEIYEVQANSRPRAGTGVQEAFPQEIEVEFFESQNDDKLKQIEAENTDLKLELTELERHNKDQRSTIKEQEIEIEQLKKANANLDKKLNESKLHEAKINSEVENLQIHYQQKLKEANAKHEQSNREKQEMASRVLNIEKKQEELARQNKAKDDQLIDLTQENRRLEMENEGFKSKLDSRSSATHQVDSLEKRMNQVVKTITQKDETIAKLEREKGEFGARLKSVKSEADRQKDTLTAQLGEKTKLLTQKSDEAELYREQVRQLQESHSEIEGELQELKGLLPAVEKSSRELQALTVRAEALNEENNILQEKLDLALSESKVLEKRADKASNEVVSLDAEIKRLRKELEQSKREQAESQRQCELLQIDVERLDLLLSEKEQELIVASVVKEDASPATALQEGHELDFDYTPKGPCKRCEEFEETLNGLETELDEKVDLCTKYEKAYKEIKMRLEISSSQQAELQGYLDETRLSNTKLEEDLDSATVAKEKLEKALEDQTGIMKTQAAALEESRSNSEKLDKSLKEALQKLQKVQDELKAQQSEAELKISRVKQDFSEKLSMTKESYEDLTNQLQDYQAQVKALEEDKEQLQMELDISKEAADNASSLQSEIDHLDAINEQLSGQLHVAQTKYKDSEENLKKEQRAKAALESEIGKLQEEVTRLNEASDERFEEQINTESKLRETEEEVSHLQQQIATVEDAAVKEKAALTSQIKQLQSAEAAAKQEVARLTKSLNELEQGNDEQSQLRTELDQAEFENGRLQQALADLEEEHLEDKAALEERLKASEEHSKGQVKILRAELAKLSQTNAELKERLHSYETSNQALEELSLKYNALQNQLQEARTREESLETSLRQQEKDYEAEVQALNKQVSSLEAQEDSLRSDIEGLEAELREAQEEAAEADERRKAAVKNLDSLEQAYDKLQETSQKQEKESSIALARVADELEVKEEENEGLQAELKRLTIANSDLQSQLETAMNSSDSLRVLSEKYSALQQKLEDAEDHIAELESDLKSVQENAQNQVSSLQGVEETLRIQVSQLEDQLKQSQGKLFDAEEKLLQLEIDLEAAEHSNAKLEASLSEATAEASELNGLSGSLKISQEQVESLQTEVGKLTKNNAELKDRLRSYESSDQALEDLSNKFSNLQLDLEQAESGKEVLEGELRQQKEQSQTQMAALNQQISSQQGLVESLRTQNENLELELTQSHNKVAECETKYTALEADFNSLKTTHTKFQQKTARNEETASKNFANVADRLETLQVEKQAMMMKFNKVTKEAETKELYIAELEEELNDAELKIKQATEKVDNLEDELARLEAQKHEIEQLKETKAEAETRLAELEQANAQLSQRIDNYKLEIESLESRETPAPDISESEEYTILKLNYEGLASRHQLADEEVGRLTDLVKSKQREVDELTAKSNRLEGESRNLKTKLDRTQEEYEDLQQLFEGVENKLRSAERAGRLHEGKLKETESECRKLQSLLDEARNELSSAQSEVIALKKVEQELTDEAAHYKYEVMVMEHAKEERDNDASELIDNLKSELSDTQDKLNEALENLRVAQDQAEDAQKKLSEAQGKANEEQVQSLREELQSKEQELHLAQETSKRVQLQLAQVNEHYEKENFDMQQEVEELNERLKEFEVKDSNQQAEIDSLKYNINQLNLGRATFEEALHSEYEEMKIRYEQTISDLEHDKIDMSEEVGVLMAKVHELEEAEGLLKQQVSHELHYEVAQFEGDLSEVLTQYLELKKQYNNQALQINSLVSEKTMSMMRLETEIRRTEQMNKDLLASRAETEIQRNERNRVSQQVIAMQEVLKSKEEELSSTKKNLNEANKELRNISSEYGSLQSSYEDTKRDSLSLLRSQSEGLKSSDDLKLAVSELQQKLTDVNYRLASVSNERDDLKAQLVGSATDAKLAQQYEKATDQIDMLETELRKAKENLNRSEQARIKYEEETTERFANQKEEIDKLQRKLEAASRVYNTLNQEMQSLKSEKSRHVEEISRFQELSPRNIERIAYLESENSRLEEYVKTLESRESYKTNESFGDEEGSFLDLAQSAKVIERYVYEGNEWWLICLYSDKHEYNWYTSKEARKYVSGDAEWPETVQERIEHLLYVQRNLEQEVDQLKEQLNQAVEEQNAVRALISTVVTTTSSGVVEDLKSAFELLKHDENFEETKLEKAESHDIIEVVSGNRGSQMDFDRESLAESIPVSEAEFANLQGKLESFNDIVHDYEMQINAQATEIETLKQAIDMLKGSKETQKYTQKVSDAVFKALENIGPQASDVEIKIDTLITLSKMANDLKEALKSRRIGGGSGQSLSPVPKKKGLFSRFRKNR